MNGCRPDDYPPYPPRGQSLVEYALLIALIAIVAIAALTFLGDEIVVMLDEIAGAL